MASRGTLLVLVAMVVLLVPVASASATTLPTTITANTTLVPAGNPYTGTSTIEAGVTLKVEPGVKFSKLSLTVKGTLDAQGTSSEPIVITESSGNLAPLVFEPGSGGSVLNHAEITKSGSETYIKAPIKIVKSSPTIKNSTLNNDGFSAIYIPEGGSPEIANNTILNSGGYGGTYKRAAIYYSAGKEATGTVNIHGNYIEKCGGGIEVSTAGSSTTSTSLGGNTVVQSESSALSYSGPAIPDDITENTLTGNTANYIQFGGTITHSLIWNAGSRLRISGGLTIASGATLTMNAGVYVINPNIAVNGTLVAEGTTESPVVFTESAEKGKGLVFEPGSGSSVLNHVEASSLGSEVNATSGLVIKKSSPKIINSTIRNAGFYGIYIPEGGSPEIANNTILNSGGYGGTYKRAAIYYTAGSGNTGNVNIHGNYIEKSGGGIAVSVSSGAAVTASALSGNTVVKTESVALGYSGPEIPGDITENFLSENTSNYLQVGGTVATSSTWNKGSKVRLTGVTIATGVTLKVTAGVYMTNPNITIKGTLLAEGTTSEPVVFTESTEKGKGLAFEAGSGASILEHVEVSKVGNETYVTPAVAIKKSSPTIKNSLFSNDGFYAIEVYEGGSPEIANNYITNSGGLGGTYKREAILYYAGKEDSGNVNIHDNVVELCGSGIAVNVNAAAPVTASALRGNVVIGTEGTGLSYSGPEIPGDITENTLVGNKTNFIQIGGTVAHSSTWKDGGSRVLVTEVTVAAGVTLKIAAGVYLANPAFSVKGILQAEGTSAKPVVFTGSKAENAGEWSNIKFEAGSSASVLDHVEVAYGGKGTGVGMVEAKGSSPTITNSTIRKSSNYGIKVTESGAPHIEWNRFRSNANGLSYSGAGSLAAPNNDWGCASGPKPAGCGDSISGNVSWKPAVQLPELAGSCRGKDSQCGEGADPVSLATGQLSYSHRDLLLTNKSRTPLEFVRTYSSGSSADSGLGPGWSQSGLASVTELESGEVLVVRQDGRQDLFQKSGSAYSAPSGVTDTLAKVEGTFQLTTLERSVYRFDSSGRIASITDDHGLKTTYAYDANGRLATITDPSGQTLTFSYNASNHITLVKDSTGREVKFAYSAAGDLESVTDALGGITKYGYDSQHRITSITDPRGNVILKNTYDSQGRITEQRDGLEDLWKLEYKAGETIVTEPRGGKRTYGFDGQNRVVSETDQLGHTTTTGYDAVGNVREVVRPGGAKWTFGHDEAGNLTSVIDPLEGERDYSYDAQNRLTGLIDARGNSWSYEWSAANDLTKVTDPEGGETTFTYNASGQPLTLTDPNSHKSEFAWDARGNRLSATDPLGHKTSFEYNSRNYLTSQTKPGLKAEAFERNALGDLLARTTPEGHKTKYAYDANGLPTQITDPAEGIWKIERNAMERPTAYVDPLGQETKFSYNGNLGVAKVVNRRGKETSFAYDLANQLTEVKRPEGEIWKYGYDSRGNRSSLLDPRGNETTYSYDPLDRMTKADEPLSVSTEYGYDPDGDLTSVKDPRGNTTSYGYDKLGRLIEIAQPLGKETTFAYDPAGNQLTRTTSLGSRAYVYDAADRLTEISSGESTLRSYGYDAADRLTGATDAEGHKIEIGYTEEGRPSTINDGRGQSLARSYDARGNLLKQVDGRGTLEYGYDKLSRMTSLTDPQGKSLGFAYDPEGDLTEVTRPNGVTTTNVYNEAGRLAETISKTSEPLSVLESLKYSYDNAGNATSRVDQRLEAETSYSYDALNRLTEFNPPGEGTTTYGYDAAGNRTEAGGTTYAFNALNQPTKSSAGTTYSYDGAGRLTAEVYGAEETNFAWDPFDHLAKVEGPGGNAAYAFDGLERLSERKSGETAKVFHYGDLGDMSTYTADGEGKTTSSYVQGAHGLVEQRSGEATSYPLIDGHGDLTAITNSFGEATSRQSFDPWGNQLSGPSLEMGYLGAWERPGDSTSSLIQMGARTYAPSLGAFTSEDPVLGHLGVGVSTNRYPYVWDNPLNRHDLNGRDVCVFAGCLGDVGETIETLPGELEEGWEYVEAGAGQVGSSIGSAAEDGWELTAPSRQWIADRAQDFWKPAGGPLTDIYNFAGANWQTCLQGGSAGAAIGFYGGTVVFPVVGSGAGAAGGGVLGCAGLVGTKLGLEALAE